MHWSVPRSCATCSGRRSAAWRPNEEGPGRMGVRVLLAEDEALIALSLADLFEAEGHDVTIAVDGAEALDAARRLGDALGVLVTDLNMPRMGGEDLIRELRAER